MKKDLELLFDLQTRQQADQQAARLHAFQEMAQELQKQRQQDYRELQKSITSPLDEKRIKEPTC